MAGGGFNSRGPIPPLQSSPFRPVLSQREALAHPRPPQRIIRLTTLPYRRFHGRSYRLPLAASWFSSAAECVFVAASSFFPL